LYSLQLDTNLALEDKLIDAVSVQTSHKTELKNIEQIRNQEIKLLKEVHDSKLEESKLQLTHMQRKHESLKDNQNFKIDLMDE